MLTKQNKYLPVKRLFASVFCKNTLITALSVLAFSGLPAVTWSKPAPANKTSKNIARTKAQTVRSSVDKTAQKKALSKVASKSSKIHSADSRKTFTVSRNTKALSKAQKLALQKQEKIFLAEQARLKRTETIRIAALKQQELAMQRQLARHKQRDIEGQQHLITKAAVAQQDDIAVPSTLNQDAVSDLISKKTANSTPPLTSNDVPTSTANSAPENTQALLVAAPKKATPAPAVVRVSVPARDVYRSGLGNIQPEASPGLYSSVAFVMDQNTGTVLLNKNGHRSVPVASITKLMTALITMDANLPMDELITITSEDVDRVKYSSSRLAVGTTLSRQELLHLALMSSENRAAHALGRTYPGGMEEAVRAMNLRALMLGMRDTRYVEPTGLSSANQSSAHDLAQLVKATYRYPLIRNYTTYPGAHFPVLGQMTRFNNTNRLIYSDAWNIGLQKTGFISEAGRCVVMQSNIAGRNVIIVLLDSSGSNRRVEDAEAIRSWVLNESAPAIQNNTQAIAGLRNAS